jgi:hypothetical protein
LNEAADACLSLFGPVLGAVHEAIMRRGNEVGDEGKPSIDSFFPQEEDTPGVGRQGRLRPGWGMSYIQYCSIRIGVRGQSMLGGC